MMIFAVAQLVVGTGLPGTVSNGTDATDLLVIACTVRFTVVCHIKNNIYYTEKARLGHPVNSRFNS
jgi:hypothetical protein